MSKAHQLLLALVAATAIAHAQSSSGTILGTVRDSQDAVIPGAVVTVTDIAKKTARTFTTSAAGEYVVPFLDPGQYAITVEATGFKKYNQSGLTVRVADRLTIDFHLEIGQMVDQVTVEAATPLVNAVTNTLGQVIENRRIIDLPLNGREPFALATLAPGVLPTPNNTAQHQGGSVPSISGAANFTSEVTIDGIPNTAPRNQGRFNFLIYTPSVDAVSEFKVQTNSMSAEYGRFNGGVISVVTKSGTNELHGTAYEFHRNSYFDANTFFNNRAGIPLGALRRNQAGGAIGGPVVLPKLYNGKDKTFFFFDYEAFRESTVASANYTVPTALERAGDFSKTVNAAGAPVLVFDPTTTRAGSGGTLVRDAFPGNVIPANRINTVGNNLVKFYPLPTNGRLTANLDIGAARVNRDDTFDVRIDHYIGTSHKIFGRVSRQEPFTGEPNYFNNIANPGNPSLTQHRRSAALQDIWTLTPTTIVNFNYGLSRQYGTRTAWGDGYDITQLGFPENFRANQQVSALPTFSISGFSGLGNGNQNYSSQMSHILQATVTRIQGSHTLKAGADYRVYFDNQLQNPSAQGSLSISSAWTQGPNPNQASTTAGNGIASLLLGIPGGSLVNQPAIASASRYWAGFVQDDWRMTRKLTLNLGLRYEVNVPRTERFDRISIFDVGAVSPIAAQVPSIPGLRGAMAFRDADNRQLIPADKNNWAPRFGFAYQMTKDTVIRGGYGIFFGLSSTDAAGAAGGFVDGFQATTSIVTSLDGTTPIASLSNPFPNGFNQPLSRSQLTDRSLLGQSNTSGLLSLATPYFQQWNFSVQRSLGQNLIAEIAYTANKGTHVPYTNFNPNTLTQAQNALGTVNQQLVPNPFYGIITDPTSSLSLPTVQRGQLLRPYPQYGAINLVNPSIGNSNYHSMQARVEKRFSKGYTLLAAYTWSKNITDFSNAAVGSTTGVMDPYNLRLERSLDSQDVPHRLVLSGVYELPFGRGRWMGSHWNRGVDMLFGGWQLNGIASFQKGEPLVMSAISGSRPIRLQQSGELSGPTQSRLLRYFDTNAFQVPAAFTLGNSSRTAPDLRGPGIANYDLSLFKTFAIYERLKAQFRFETFNAMNRVWFGMPSTSIGSTSAGVISSQANSPRQLQLALKFLF
ncbi:MAG: TonB-dependent receptor [Acidobacteria bacterium]|nr:TonB-dependent receptor [Acidobacteriota bacterium]